MFEPSRYLTVFEEEETAMKNADVMARQPRLLWRKDHAPVCLNAGESGRRVVLQPMYVISSHPRTGDEPYVHMCSSN